MTLLTISPDHRHIKSHSYRVMYVNVSSVKLPSTHNFYYIVFSSHLVCLYHQITDAESLKFTGDMLMSIVTYIFTFDPRIDVEKYVSEMTIYIML